MEQDYKIHSGPTRAIWENNWRRVNGGNANISLQFIVTVDRWGIAIVSSLV